MSVQVSQENHSPTALLSRWDLPHYVLAPGSRGEKPRPVVGEIRFCVHSPGSHGVETRSCSCREPFRKNRVEAGSQECCRKRQREGPVGRRSASKSLQTDILDRQPPHHVAYIFSCLSLSLTSGRPGTYRNRQVLNVFFETPPVVNAQPSAPLDANTMLPNPNKPTYSIDRRSLLPTS